jgi:hypothetical protein
MKEGAAVSKLLVLATVLLTVQALGAPGPAAPAVMNTAVGARPAKAAVAGVRHMIAEVVSVDWTARILTVKRTIRHKTKESAFTVEPDAASGLADLKAGERVKISYVESGGKLVAKAIVSASHVAKK